MTKAITSVLCTTILATFALPTAAGAFTMYGGSWTDLVGEAGESPTQMWAPPDSNLFKTAAVCHLPRYDYYAVFAVFEVDAGGTTEDELWFLRVDGMSTWHEYGEVVGSARVATEDVISHVDCASDGYDTAYVTWDRSDDPYDTEGSRWRRVSRSGSMGSTQDVGECFGQISWSPSIAFHEDASLGELVAIAAAPRADCNHCWYVFEADSGDEVGQGTDFASAVGVTTRATAIEYNGDGQWLMAWLSWLDGGPDEHPAAIFTRVIDLDGDSASGSHTEIWSSNTLEYPDSEIVDRIDLVHADNEANDEDTFLIQTWRRAAWVDREGHAAAASLYWPFNPTEVGPWEHFAACAYWGSEWYPLAHAYHETASNRTEHLHWTANPWIWLDAEQVDSLYRVPVECGSSTDYDDAETVLVRAYPNPTNAAATHAYIDLLTD